MNSDAITTLDFIDQHLYGARRMRTAHSRVGSGANAAYPLKDYRKDKLGECGPDPNQLLQRLAFALQAAERPVSLFRQRADLVKLKLRDLIWRPSDGHTGNTQTFKLDAVRKQILEAFAGVHVFGCFRPHRYADDLGGCILGDPSAVPKGFFLFQAEFLVWGCKPQAMRRRLGLIEETQEDVTHHPFDYWSGVGAGHAARAFLDIVSAPRKQYKIDWIEGCNEYFARETDLDGCGEIELKEVLKSRPFSSMVFACGEGQRIIDGAEKCLPAALLQKGAN